MTARQAPRVLRSPMTETWYVVTRWRTRPNGVIEALTKYPVHPEDAAGLEAAYLTARKERRA